MMMMVTVMKGFNQNNIIIWNKVTLGPYINADTPVLSMIKCVSRYFLADVQLVR